MKIYEELFGDFYILLYKPKHYKVYKFHKRIKKEVYEAIARGERKRYELTEDDYKIYEDLVATHVSLFGCLIYIFEQNVLFNPNKIGVYSFVDLTIELKKYENILK